MRSGTALVRLPIVLLHVSLCVITDFHFHTPNTMYVFYAAVCCLLSMLSETDNKVLLVSYNINNGVCLEQFRHHDCVCV